MDNREEGSYECDNEKPTPLRPCVLVQLNAASLKTVPVMALSIDIPSIHVDLSKSHFDGLQYFADDVAQFLERMSADTNVGEPDNDSRETNLIGSLFFAKSRAESLNSSVAESGESVIKLMTTEGEAFTGCLSHMTI
jgi:autophagy-related protein 2